jgi:hypothetical protein
LRLLRHLILKLDRVNLGDKDPGLLIIVQSEIQSLVHLGGVSNEVSSFQMAGINKLVVLSVQLCPLVVLGLQLGCQLAWIVHEATYIIAR